MPTLNPDFAFEEVPNHQAVLQQPWYCRHGHFFTLVLPAAFLVVTGLLFFGILLTLLPGLSVAGIFSLTTGTSLAAMLALLFAFGWFSLLLALLHAARHARRASARLRPKRRHLAAP